jgi:CheY-like chemotaxis protein
LVVDDEPADLKRACEVAESLGFEDVQARNTVRAAHQYLEKGLAGEQPLPDAIVIDLDFGHDSGFELLRLWHSTPQLKKIPVLVWSVVEEQKQICELFRVNCFVSKGSGVGAFREALGQLIS